VGIVAEVTAAVVTDAERDVDAAHDVELRDTTLG
jgi:hypothetical protein